MKYKLLKDIHTPKRHVEAGRLFDDREGFLFEANCGSPMYRKEDIKDFEEWFAPVEEPKWTDKSMRAFVEYYAICYCGMDVVAANKWFPIDIALKQWSKSKETTL